MFGCAFQPGGQADTGIAQRATLTPCLVLHADQDAFGQIGSGEIILP